MRKDSRCSNASQRKRSPEAGIDPDEIDTVVTSVRAASRRRLCKRARCRDSDCDRTCGVPVVGLGCAGGVSGLSIASRLASVEAGSTVLVVVLELCSLAFRLDRRTKEDAVAAALFADGAAALVLRSAPDGPVRVRGSAEYIWPDTLDIMGWTFDPSASAWCGLARCDLASAAFGRREASPFRGAAAARRSRPVRLPSGRGKGG